jgi:chromosomal replication initiation ATPase DnaA
MDEAGMLTPHERRVAWLKRLCEDCDVCYEDVMGRSRLKRISNVRALAYLKFRQDGLTLPVIGRFFGRDHTTVMKVTNNMIKAANGQA